VLPEAGSIIREEMLGCGLRSSRDGDRVRTSWSSKVTADTIYNPTRRVARTAPRQRPVYSR
jgi:hypothetical protein